MDTSDTPDLRPVLVGTREEVLASLRALHATGRLIAHDERPVPVPGTLDRVMLRYQVGEPAITLSDLKTRAPEPVFAERSANGPAGWHPAWIAGGLALAFATLGLFAWLAAGILGFLAQHAEAILAIILLIGLAGFLWARRRTVDVNVRVKM